MLRRVRGSRALRIAAWTIVPLVIAVVTVMLVLFVVNTRVLPGVVDRALASFGRASAVHASVDDVRYDLFRGIVARGVVVEHAPSGAAVEIDRVTARYSLRSLLALRRGLPVSISDRKPTASDPWSIIRLVADSGALPRRLDLIGVSLSLPVAGRRLSVLFDDATLRHDAAAAVIRAAATASGTPGASFEARADYATGTALGEVRLRQLQLAGLGIDGGTADAELIVRTESADRYEVAGSVSVADLVVSIAGVASEPVGFDLLEYRFAATVEPDFPVVSGPRGRVRFHTGRLVVNGVAAEFLPELVGLGFRSDESIAAQIPEEPRAFTARLTLPATPVAAIHESVPVVLQGELRSIKLDGTLGWDLSLRVPLDTIGEMEWRSTVELDGFRVEAIPAPISPFAMNDSFVHVIRDDAVDYARSVRVPTAALPPVSWTVAHSEHAARYVTAWRARDAETAARVSADPPRALATEDGVGDADPLRPDPTYRYLRLAQMSPWVVRAVLTAEDGDFFFHDGVNFYTLPRALERNVRAGEIQFGASTLSMQLAKMLFLDQQRLVSRKLQEVFLVYLMENVVPVSKERILELYLNLAEFGPGVFGIADAARYYFAKHPADLDAGEATWLASILPSPKRYHDYYLAGGITPGWFERMKGYFDIMLERGRMTEAEHETASREPPAFAP